MDVLEHEQEHAVASDALEHAEQRLEHASADEVGGLQGRRPAVDAEVVEALGEAGDDRGQICGGVAHDLRQAFVRQGPEGAVEGLTDGLVGHAQGRLVCAAAAGQDAGHARDTVRQLIEKTRAADAGRPGQHDTTEPSLRNSAHGFGQLGQLALSAQERHRPEA